MAEFLIDTDKVKAQVDEEEKIAQELAGIRKRLERQLNEVGTLGTEFSYVKDGLKQIVEDVKAEEKDVKVYADCLNNIVMSYENTEKKITSIKITKGETANTSKTTDKNDELENAYEKGILDEETYKILKSISSGLFAFSMATLQNMLTNFLQDMSAEALANALWSWLRENTTYFMDRGMVAALAGGGEAFFTEAPSWLASVLRGGAQIGVPIIGTLIDFSIQKLGGEDTGDAMIKASAHTLIGLGSVAVGTQIGAAIGSVVPGAGTIVGAIIGAAGSVAFDYVYDNWDNIVEGAGNVIDKVENWAETAGNALVDAFQGLGSVFG